MKSNQVFYVVGSFLWIAFLLNSFSVKGQKRCNSNQLMQLQLNEHPEILANKMASNRLVIQQQNQQQKTRKTQQAVVTIPVVFHVLYNNAEENLSFDQLQSQIDVLNEDYRRQNDNATNTWSQATDAQIEFCFANIDLNGNYFEGVTRKFTSKSEFNPNSFDMFSSSTGGKEIWPDYLNIYVCDLDVFKEGVLGTAPFPGYYPAYDGVVLDYRVVGRQQIVNGTELYKLVSNYDLGRTATHEVGHWLDLEHPWGSGNGGCNTDDNITDTPNSAEPYNACDVGTSCGTTDMVENFMDYHFDGCMSLFTQGQADRMIASINIYRPYLVNNTKCSNCLSSVNVNQSFQSEVETIISNDVITAQNDIYDDSNISYFAKNRITLNSGFSLSLIHI